MNTSLSRATDSLSVIEFFVVAYSTLVIPYEGSLINAPLLAKIEDKYVGPEEGGRIVLFKSTLPPTYSRLGQRSFSVVHLILR